MLPDEVLQIRKENIFTQGRADADPQLPNPKLCTVAEFFFTGLDSSESFPDPFIQDLTVCSQGNTAGGSGKQGTTQIFFQTGQGFTDSRLADKESICSL